MHTDSVKLDNIAILIALPVSKRDFLTRVQESDWLGKFRDTSLDREALERSLCERWSREYYSLVAEPLLSLIDSAHRLGAEIKTQARLNDISEMSAKKGVVIIFAHWKGAEVIYDDITSDVSLQKFVDQGDASDAPIARWIVAQLSQAENHRVALDDVLNEALLSELPYPHKVGSLRILESDISRSAERRDQIDKIFNGLLRPGNRLELYDGLHDKMAIASSISPRFEGVLDLSACNSMVLGTYLAGQGKNRFRTVQFPKVVEFLWAATVVQGTLSLIASGGFSYQEARLAVTQILNEAVSGMPGRE